MTRSLPRRLLTGAALLATLSLVVFVGVDLLPGDPVTSRVGPGTAPDRIAELRHDLGLDRPVLARYGEWLAGLAHGDLGTSASGRPVADMLSDRPANSAVLAVAALLLLVPLSLGLGLWAAWHGGRTADRVVSAGALLLVSVPEFVVAGALVVVFAGTLRVLPAVSLLAAGESPLSRPEVLVLPVTSLLLVGLAYAVRVIRASAAATLAGPHVEFLRLSGVSPAVVLRRAVVPAVLPVAVQVWLVTGVSFAGGAVLVEKVFSYPGIGELLVTSVQSGDLPVVQAIVLLLGGAMLAVLVLADLAVVALTPRLRTAGAR
ncbi:ABC transporter permease [Pseudonocardia sp. HH130630-07]|uniref:ABC transporter permease n=1 Tax=Pseudonocardia sp. HH130630-07 TaxID=1690815 RepID=UPI000815349F|nr:ABC transporter permease [Pseudonocardia sp. HH130630-07]ANY08117.1 ABC transporter permease [Pseudonocardia sp. HH130630-07]